MVKFRFSEKKQEILRSLEEKRSNVDLEEVASMLSNGKMIDIVTTPNYPTQNTFILPYKGDILAIPCEPQEDKSWLIMTAWYSRKRRREYLEAFYQEQIRYYGRVIYER